jgi:hypothetical protein
MGVKRCGTLYMDDAQTEKVRNKENLSTFIPVRNRNGVTSKLSCGNELPKGLRERSRRRFDHFIRNNIYGDHYSRCVSRLV